MKTMNKLIQKKICEGNKAISDEVIRNVFLNDIWILKNQKRSLSYEDVEAEDSKQRNEKMYML